MELFQYLVHPLFHIILVVVLNLLKLFKIIKWKWLVVNIPTIILVIFWIVVLMIYANMLSGY